MDSKTLVALIVGAFIALIIHELINEKELKGVPFCAALGKEMKLDSKYVTDVGCMIRVDGQFVPLKNYMKIH